MASEHDEKHRESLESRAAAAGRREEDQGITERIATRTRQRGNH